MTISDVIGALQSALNTGSGQNDPVLFYTQSGSALNMLSGVQVIGNHQFLPSASPADESKFVITFVDPS